jgi:hypothetical protein
MRYIVAKPTTQEIAEYGFYSSYDDAARRCEVLNHRAGAPEREPWVVCQLVKVNPTDIKRNQDDI